MNAIDLNPSIAIAGGGIGGLTAALALARLGLRVTVIEQAPALQEIGAGIQMGPNAFKIFGMLGLRERLDKVAVFPDRYQINDALTGENITHIPYGKTAIERFGYPYGVIHRHDLHSALVDACVAAGVEVILQTRVAGYDQSADDVTISSVDGRTFRARALIGADGINSRIRAQMMTGKDDPIAPGLPAARCVLRIDEVPEEVRPARITIWLGEGCHVICYPLRAGELLNFAAVFSSDTDPHGPDWNMRAELQRTFANLAAPVRPLLKRLGDTLYFGATERSTPIVDWTDGLVTLLGDAAHAMTQNLAQGGCMAIEDGVVLADAIAQNPDDIPTAFRLYAERRSPRVTHVQYVARLMGDILHLKGAERNSRNFLLRAREPRDNLEFFAWLYQGIDIAEETLSRLRPGMLARAP
jgi:3-hydroxybenzoate 6-monooxygenase